MIYNKVTSNEVALFFYFYFMDKQEILKRFFTNKEQDIYNRVQYKLEYSMSFRNDNSFEKIWKDYWITKQGMQQLYKKIEKHLNNLYIKLKKDEIK
jgi:hypothetical protein